MRNAVVAILTTLVVVGIQYAVRYLISGWNVNLLVALAVAGMVLAVAVVFNERWKARVTARQSAQRTSGQSQGRGEPLA